MEQVAVFTPEQLKAFTVEVVRETLAAGQLNAGNADNTQRRFVYGLRGIRELFNVSHPTAQQYKNTFLRPAITQRGRKIMVDVEKAIELFNAYQNR
jgi:hypothetical protein